MAATDPGPIRQSETVFPPECETVTMQRHEVDGRVFGTVVGFDHAGKARWTACLYWDTPNSEWVNGPEGD